MDDLISRAAAIAKVEKARKAARTLTGMDFVLMLENQPAVDAVPVEERLNLCESCTKEFAECGTGKDDLVFGSGVGNDNIIGCPRYVNRWKARESVGYIHDANNREGDVFFCEQCKAIVGENITGVIGYRKVRHNYCPSCGRAVKWE